MFKKVLVAEDMDDINKGVHANLCELGIDKIQQVQYCDDAYLRFKKALLDKEPFELLITDLSFTADHREQRLKSGADLIKALKSLCPELKIIVYSVEDRLQKVRSLVNDDGVNAYVCKSRRGLIELSRAINTVFQDKIYVSPKVEQALSSKADLEITDYDIELIRQLSYGLNQEEIGVLFKKNGTKPNSLSSIEKRLSKLRIDFKANNAVHLVTIFKDLGLI